MEEVDNFPFDSIEDFENAVNSFLTHEKGVSHAFAFAPPINTSHFVCTPTVESPRAMFEEDKRKSPHARVSHGSKEWMEEIGRLEARMDEKLEQLHSLYFYVMDKIKQLEKMINK